MSITLNEFCQKYNYEIFSSNEYIYIIKNNIILMSFKIADKYRNVIGSDYSSTLLEHDLYIMLTGYDPAFSIIGVKWFDLNDKSKFTFPEIKILKEHIMNLYNIIGEDLFYLNRTFVNVHQYNTAEGFTITKYLTKDN